jgi:hypothetical protein
MKNDQPVLKDPLWDWNVTQSVESLVLTSNPSTTSKKKKGSEGGAWCIRAGRELSDPKLSSFFFG